MKTITVRATDDRYTLREALRRVDDERVLVALPWDVDRGWTHPLDFEVQLRIARDRRWQIAWAIEDPERRAVAKKVGFTVFGSEQAAEEYLARNGGFPPVKSRPALDQPKLSWWSPTPRSPKPPSQKRPPAWLLAIEGILLMAVLGVVAVAYFLAVPSAKIILRPASTSFSRIVPVSVDPSAEGVDLQRGVIPSTRIGDEFEGYAEVVTSGRGYSFSGRASGRVLFTNLLGQAYQVPEGTVVRTSAGSYPVRYETTEGVTVPAFGQVEAPVEALVEGPRGNVDAYQINLVEGVVGFAVRATNPEPIAGAESDTVRTVSQEDRDRAWDLAAQQVMANAYNGLQEMASEVPGRFLPRQTLVIQAAPKAAYTHLVGEQTDVLGLSLRLLVTGQVVEARDAQAIAYQQLVTQLPEGYTLSDARFSIGEAAEEDIGAGQFTFFITAYGHAAAKIDGETVKDLSLGTRVEEAKAQLQESLPLAEPPEIAVSPEWFPFIPYLPIRTQIVIDAAGMAP